MNAVSPLYRLSFLVCFASALVASAVAQSVTASPTSLSFGNQVQGTSTSVQKVTLKNGQKTAITLTSITPSLSDYSQTNSCPVSPSTLGSGKSCTISVTFTPAALGSRTATLTIKDTGTNSPQTVSLSGTGIASVTASPSSIFFGNQVIALKSAASKVTVTNNQSKSLSITKTSTSLADFTTTSTCPVPPSTLSAGSSCTISVFFTPAVAGTRIGTLTISDNASVSPTVSLTGNGVVAAVASPTPLTFASQAMGTSSAPQTVILTNNQSTALTVTSVSSSPSDFTVTSTCPSSLAAGASCTASVTFSPKAQGSRSGTLTFSDSANNSPQTVPLSGTGAAPNLTSIAVTPANSSVAAGLTQQFTATGTYTDGSTQNLTSSVSWSSSAQGTATISSTGLATGVTAGVSSITATSGSITGSTSLTVAAATLVSIAVTPANPSFAKGTTQVLKATGTFTDGSTQDVTNSASWTTANSAVATVNSVGVASAVSAGSTSVTATRGVIAGSTTLTVTPATLVSISVTPAIPSIPLGTTQQFTATGTFTDGGTQNLTSTVQWSSDTPSTANISNSTNSQGLATSVGAGTTNITATSGSISGSTMLTVTPAVLVSIAVTPPSPSIALGTNQQFTATGTFTDGNTKDLTATAAWTSDTTSTATVSNTGLATSVANGSATISATSNSIAGSTLLTVTPAQLVSIAIAPAVISVPVGVPQPFTATGTYTDGSRQDLTQSGHWSSTSANVATISDASGSQGVATTLIAGTTTIGISSGSVSASATLTVLPAALVSISISPAMPTIPLGTNQQFTASGSYTDGSSQDLTSVVTWTSSDAGIAVISDGLASSSGVGAAKITATLNSISNSTTLNVAAANLVSISVSPANSAIPLGTTQQFSAAGKYTDGTTQDLTSSVTWSSSANTVATISASGLSVGIGLGGTNITATSGAVQSSAGLTVNPPVLIALTVSPSTSSIPNGRQQQFTALGTYSDGNTLDLTNAVTWFSSAPVVASVLGTGVATGVAVGSTTITASSGLITASAALTVQQAVLVSIALTPVNTSFALGTNLSLIATGTYSDGSTLDLTKSAVWSTVDSSIVTLNSTGVATSVAVGSTSVGATSGAIAGSTTLTITPAVLVSIAVTPAIPTLALGITQQFTATGTYTDGSTQNITGTVQWSSDTPATATISNDATTTGLASSVAPGTANILATSGSVTGSTTLTVTSASLVSLAVAPVNPSIALGTTQQFTAIGTYTDGSTQDLTSTATWASDTQAAATINNAGLSQSLAIGTATITASSGSVSSATTVTVTSAALVSIVINPPLATIPLGTSQQFTATGTFTDGSTQDLTQSGHWSSTAASVATISNTAATAGLASTFSAGTTTIGISSGAVSAMASLVVNPAALVSIAISPLNPSIALGTTQQFTAQGTYSDGTTQDLTSAVTWNSSNSTVAIVSNGLGSYGLATSSGLGTATISATFNSVSNATTINVGQASVTSIAVSPSSISIALGYNEQFSATATYSDGSTQDITQSATWSSSTPGIASVNATGNAISIAAGTTTISASFSSASSGAVLTVSPAVPIALVITPSSSSVAFSGQQQFSATLNYSDGSSLNVTSTATWISLNSAVATISNSGLSTGIASGSCTIEATWGNSLSATATLTVLPPAVVVSPSSGLIAISGTQQYTAVVTGDSNQTVTWSVDGIPGGSNSGTVGLISASGLYTAPPNFGNHTITATSRANPSNTGSAALTVVSNSKALPAVPYFGIDYNVGTPFGATAISHGIGRLWDTPGAEWSFVQTSACGTSPCPGSFNWTTVDNTLSLMQTNGVYTAQIPLSRTPNFASSNAANTSCNYYKTNGSGGAAAGQCDPPKDLNSDGTGLNQYWRDWVAAYASHVNAAGYTNTHARVAYWEIWNEPDSAGFWTGSMDQLIRMQEDAYCIIKGGSFTVRATGESCTQVRSAVKSVAVSGPIDSTALILMPSYHAQPTSIQLAQAFLYCTGPSIGAHCHTGGHSTTDVINFHTKPGSNYPTTMESVMNSWTAAIKGFLQSAELSKPLFGTEGGYAPSGWISPYTTDLNQAAYIARFYIFSYYKGFANNVWYAYNTSINGLGSLAADTAYSQIYSGLVGATSLTCSVSANGTGDAAQPSLYTCTFNRPDGTAAQWMWDTDNSGQPAFWDTGAANNLECHNGTCPTHPQSVPSTMLTYIDLTGVKTSISGNQVPVGIRPILVQAKP